MSNNRDSSGGGWFVYDESSDSYDLNTRILATAVIFLAAVVVFVIVLHIYVRHIFFRRRRNNLAASAASGSRLLRFYVTDPAHDDHVAAPGLDPSAIAALLARPYRSTEGGDGACAICLSAVEDAEMVRVLPGCGHLFHVGCIDMWLGSHCTCPVCRAAVEPPSATTPASQEEASLGAKESESARILSWERSTARRPQGQGMEDLERQ
ncbi:RING-H2 finger protein ATL2-like [Curcuma longa]|uniref:RING-H2 finger protein ATL2-like n=1 Tax=Curcuma longa TaxID=136217 RepID=UPI003D9E7AF2